MSYWSWKNIKIFYEYYCKNNEEFRSLLNEVPLTNYEDISLNFNNKNIINKDLNESNDNSILIQKYLNNSLIVARLGNVESDFILKERFALYGKYHLINLPIDYYIKKNAGLYYVNELDKEKVWKWMSDNSAELLVSKDSILGSCFCHINFDIVLWSYFSIKKIYYNYYTFIDIILKNSNNKNILFVGYNTESVKYSHKTLQKKWKFKISNFKLFTLKTPQTTEGCDYPDNNSIETSNKLIESILNLHKIHNIDTIIFCCGCYACPLINIIRKKINNLNLLSLGSLTLNIFGIYTKHMCLNNDCGQIQENFILPLESLPKGCENHPEKKYWNC